MKISTFHIIQLISKINSCRYLWTGLAILTLLSCQKETKTDSTLFHKIDASISDVNFTNQLTPNDSINILDYLYYYNGGGVAIGDINNDGLPDIYFTANQSGNKLYLNKGNFEFEDITDTAGVSGTSDWNTGVTMADVNGDGFLDIYVCAVSGIQGLKGHNELFINQGDHTFIEKSKAYNLDFDTFATSASFFDCDNDGDLDVFLLNHATHTEYSFGSSKLRDRSHPKSGDRLLKNEGTSFIDVTQESGIYNGGNGYGLGVITQDFNNDGFTDLYVSNDFHEDDYYYINNKNGTFTEQLKSKFGHISRFSMGSDASDINNDGFSDIITLDMAAEEEEIYKASEGDESLDMLQMRINKLGYHYQFSRNMLQINQAADYFSETALFSGLAYTDWSWSALFSDFDQDGKQDVFISNGIPQRPNDLDFIKYISNREIKKQLQTTSKIDAAIFKKMPSGLAQNQIFRGRDNLHFSKETKKWLPSSKTASTGSAYADLDNDGDLDLVVNNINEKALILENTIDTTANYLKLKFSYKDKNKLGIGTKVILYADKSVQVKQLYTSKGFQSSSEPILHFGLGKRKKIDSLKVLWPDGTYQIAENVAGNQNLTIQLLNKRNKITYENLFSTKDVLFRKIDSLPGLQIAHVENNYNDVNRQKLIPYQISDRGPAVATGDLNNDGKEDIFIGSSRGKNAQIFLQAEKGYVKKNYPALNRNRIQEEVAAVIVDLYEVRKNELLVGVAGGEFFGKSKELQNKRYFLQGDSLRVANLYEDQEQTAVIKPYDFDQDGDLDLFVGNYTVANDFGKIPDSYLLENTNGKLIPVQTNVFNNIGMVTDAVWTDFNNDGIKDLLVVGEWMAPVFLENNNGSLENTNRFDIGKNLKGLWQCVVPFDIDQDGDEDYLLGNFGDNSKFSTVNGPIKLYYSDFDNNEKSETVLAVPKGKEYYTAYGFDQLSMQMNYLKKKYNSYKEFAGKTVEEIIGRDRLKKAQLLEIYNSASGYLKRDGENLKFIPFKTELQVAPLKDMLVHDFNKDGEKEVLMGGNYFGVIPYHGRLDGFGGALLKNSKIISNASELGMNWSQKSLRNLNIINFAKKEYVLATFNNDEAEIYEYVGKDN